MKRVRLIALGALSWLCACYGAPELSGPYRCDEGGGCGPSLVCDDGVCCSPLGEPRCRSWVLDGGACAGGGSARPYYLDQDADGYGNPSNSKLYCAAPVFDPYIAQGGDCDDASPNRHPGAKEECDGLDNDCDGTADNGGLPTQTYYEDADNDGYGDPGQSRPFCAGPLGWVENQSDCGPEDPARYPGAPERCNGLDDNCNGSKDEAPVEGTGASCEVLGKQGVCKEGIVQCAGGAPACVSVNSPSLDLCNGKDDDCDGELDERPDCGGPADLFVFSPELTYGAQNVGSALNGGFSTPTCIKDLSGSTGETWSSPKWTGSGSVSHVFWVETSKSWDLSRAGTRIRLKFDHTMFNAAPTAWAQHGQPVIYLCGASSSSLIRFVHFAGGSAVPLMSGASGTGVEALIPLAGEAGTWVIGANTNIDLTRVKRLEVMVQPNYGTATPTFTLTWKGGAGGSGFLP